MERPHVLLEGVGKSYPAGDRAVPALRGVDLTVEAGEYVMVFGPSGSGKSTLLGLIAGLEQPTEGTVRVHGRDLSHYTEATMARYHRRHMGIVFQGFNLLPLLKVWENVAVPLVPDKVPARLRRKRALALLEQMDVAQYADRFPGEISGGEQQRVAIARALIHDPQLLVVDEPTGNLDSQAAGEVMAIFRRLNQDEGRTILLVTHNPEYLREASRVVYVRDGRIVPAGNQEAYAAA